MDKKTKMKFNVLAIFVIIIFCFALTPKTLQNDTYYTMKDGTFARAAEPGLLMERFMFSADLIEAVRCGPGAVRGRQYRLVRERAGAAFPERGQCLIEPTVA